VKEQAVQDVDPGAHQGHDYAGDGADQRSQRDQARLSRAHDGAEPPRYLQLAGQFVDQRGSPQARSPD
jgi:hypothetical protein